MKNAEAAIFNWRRGRVKHLSTAGRRDERLKNFRTGGGLSIWGGVLLLGDQYTIT